jgi:ribose transport system permease protein
MSVADQAAPAGQSERTSPAGVVQRVATRGRSSAVVVIFVILFITLSIASGPFLTKENLLNICDEWSSTGIIAVAATLVLIAGGFDLSVAAVFSISGIVAAKLASSMGVAPALLIGALSGLLIGALNGVIVVGVKVNSIIVTLAMGFIIDGLSTQLTGGNLITVTNPSFSSLGTGTFLGASIPTWCFVGTALILGFVLHATVYGRYLYAVGDNVDAAKLAGVRTGRTVWIAYALCGLAAGFAGVIIASQQATGQAQSAPDLVFNVIAAVVVGGTSILGGAGAVWRTVVGVGLLALIGNGATLLNLSQTWFEIISGVIILGASALDVLGRRQGSS